MVNYLDVLGNLATSLRQNPQIKVVESKYHLDSPLSRDDILALANKHQIELSDAVVNFYATTNGGRLEWVLSDQATVTPPPRRHVWGTFNLFDLPSMLTEGEDILWHNTMDSQTRRERKKLRIFDFFNIDSAACVCFVVENQRLEPNLVLHVQDTVYPLNMDVSTYISQLIKTRGLYSWHQAILHPNGKDAAYVKEYLPLLFNEPFP